MLFNSIKRQNALKTTQFNREKKQREKEEKADLRFKAKGLWRVYYANNKYLLSDNGGISGESYSSHKEAVKALNIKQPAIKSNIT